MELKNIYNRKEFVKINEFGGTSGGVGDRDGFANNAKLKDTLLGKVINGLFRGAAWLWRKSKENFVINKLIAKLINELMRGIILYCFANNIDLETGEQSGVEVKEEDKDKDEDENQGETETPVQEVPEVSKEIDFDVIRKDTTVEPHLIEFDPEKPDETIRKKVSYGFPVAIPDVNQIVVKPTEPEYYENITKEMYDFLSKHVNDFEKMTDEQKKQIKTIYVNYEIVKKISDGLKKQSVTESLINEESLVNTINKNISTSGTVRPKLDNPEAGRVGLGKTIALKDGASANVGNILNKRDKEKYKDKEESFDININNINLAEIEKLVESKGEQDKVSEQVNPESIKVIQISAAQLINSGPSEKEGSNDKSALQLRWNKELTKVYASFSSIMNIKMVDIRGEYRSDLDSRVKERAIGSIKRMDHQMKTEKFVDSDTSDKVLQKIPIKFSSMNGKYTYFSFHTSVGLGTQYIASAVSVNQFHDDTIDGYLLKIENTFSFMDFDNNKFESNFDDFRNQYTYKGSKLPNDMDIYFLFKNPQYGAGVRQTTMLILNYDKRNDKLYLINFKDGGNIQNFMDIQRRKDEEIKKWTIKIYIDSMRLYNYNLNGLEKTLGFKLADSGKDYSLGGVPNFYSNKEIFNEVKKVKDLII